MPPREESKPSFADKMKDVIAKVGGDEEEKSEKDDKEEEEKRGQEPKKELVTFKSTREH